jgi:hypothetical protein
MCSYFVIGELHFFPLNFIRSKSGKIFLHKQKFRQIYTEMFPLKFPKLKESFQKKNTG